MLHIQGKESKVTKGKVHPRKGYEGPGREEEEQEYEEEEQKKEEGEEKKKKKKKKVEYTGLGQEVTGASTVYWLSGGGDGSK
jgi:hypothetical protein